MKTLKPQYWRTWTEYHINTRTTSAPQTCYSIFSVISLIGTHDLPFTKQETILSMNIVLKKELSLLTIVLLKK